ncbi:Uncharacterized conserved protein, contains GH25 family domain [Nannocystis exedens]|uniref:Uncharacterized conserved protein, contains GH25 family domain n=1 Tax=Nannocystis exedens TaxID=54 RepID=A0A1I1Y872_9BACT|nr:DUF4198 domain-containing protein [Nannocystis exedens]PCC71798.1 Nickel uptake substrate-specific transmembrane region [Nannocystis exedens]SFE14313.1 Uncharacterized conserved protein, contains GH25 family domain [Nannocystis exedens]
MPSVRVLALGFLAAFCLAFPARAHDYWLEFSPLSPAAGGALALSLWVGEDFTAEAQKAMERRRLVSLRQITALGELDLLAQARDGAAPFLDLRLGGAGGYLFGLERDASHIELKPLKFNRYLRHEGLGAAFAERKRAGERWQPGRERYTRYLKSFVQVGDPVDGVSTRVLGHRLELVPDRDLAAVRPGDRLGVQLQFLGEPLAGATVEAFARGRDGRVVAQAATTDADGRARFTVAASGPWLLRAVHMRRCAGCKDADWESFWSSYGFAVR